MKSYDVKPTPGLHPELGVLLASLDDSTREWRDELGDVPVDAITWQPFPGGHSIGGILLHIAEVEAYWIEEFAAGHKLSKEDQERFMSEQILQYDVQWPTPPAQPLSHYYGILDEVRQRTYRRMSEVNTPERVYERRDETYTMRWILSHVVQHDSYHGGQAVLLKLIWEHSHDTERRANALAS